MLLALFPVAGRAQDDPAANFPQNADQNGQAGDPQARNAPASAFGSGNTIPSATENPPISALDQPSLEPGAISRSFLTPGVVVSEAGGSNIPNKLGATSKGPQGGAETRVIGNVTLQKLWRNQETDLQYSGGGIFYEGVNHGPAQLHEAVAAQRFVWRTGQVALRDSVSYLPEGSFGAGSYGGSGSLKSALSGLGGGMGAYSSGSGVGSGLGGGFSAGQFAGIGQTPRLTNSAAADVVESLNPRSSLTGAAGYGFVHFTDASTGLIDSNQFTAQVGYDRQLNRTDQLAVAYAFQNIHFPQVPNSYATTDVIDFSYGHRVSGRINLVAAVGPQFTQTHLASYPQTSRVSASGNVRLSYRFTRASVQLAYRRYTTNGSGFFLGSKSNVGTASASRPLGRVWETNAEFGVASEQRLGSAVRIVPASSAISVFAGAAAHRHLGRHYRGFLSYQYNRTSFDSSVCVSGTCGKVSDRHMGVLGVEWYPRPLRLD